MVDVSGLNSTQRLSVDVAETMALGYVWGRLDAGERGLPGDAAEAFPVAYAERKRAFVTEQTHFMPSLSVGFQGMVRDGPDSSPEPALHSWWLGGDVLSGAWRDGGAPSVR